MVEILIRVPFGLTIKSIELVVFIASAYLPVKNILYFLKLQGNSGLRRRVTPLWELLEDEEI